jgi:hypothetical protein
MKKHPIKKLLCGSLAFVAVVAAPAMAADMPVKAPLRVETGGWYFWLDGTYQSQRLPGYALGYHAQGPVASPDLGPVQGFDPRVTGAGFSTGVGYVLPPGTWPGANARVEISGSYAHLTGSQSAAATFAPGASSPVFVNGATANFRIACVVAFGSCSYNTGLTTDLAAGQINGRLASDYYAGSFTVTPSIAIFGGHARTNQSLVQAFQGNGATGEYSASTQLKWNDVGAKLGADFTTNLWTGVSFGVGGSVGVANRHVDLAASDSSIIALGGPPGTAATSFATSATTTAFLANAEARLMFRPVRNVLLRVFAGVNYDSRIPGISSPSYTGTDSFNPTSTTPIGITYAAETSYYAGGGITWRFDGTEPPLTTTRY